MQEKRSLNRLEIRGLAQIKRHSSEIPLEAQIVDISYSGMRLYASEPLSDQVEISLCYFADGTSKNISEIVKGRVTWCKQKGLWYSIGIQFHGLNPQDHAATLSFLDKHIKIE